MSDPAPGESQAHPGRRHRGQHPADRTLFAAAQLPVLRAAVAELSWLLGRGYPPAAALKLVGDRHELRKRQRKAVSRSACSDAERAARRRAAVPADALAGRTVAIDGFNCIITLEAALSGGVVLIGRDGAYRDLSSVHGSYRQVHETEAAVAAVAGLLTARGTAAARWYLDRPVSNSGRLAAVIRDAAPAGMDWTVELVYNPDRALVGHDGCVVASSDAWVLDHCRQRVDLPRATLAHLGATAWTLNLDDLGDRGG